MAAVEAVVSIPGVVSKINSEAEATSPPVPLVASVPGSATSPAAAAPAQGAFDYAGSVLRHPQLTDEEKHALIWVLAQSPAFSGLIAAADFGGADSMPDWQRCTGLLGISISRQDPVPPERTYRMRGVAEVPLSAEVAYELVTDFDYMQKWDGMLQSIHFLDRAIHAYPILSTGCFINTYGLPGMAWLFNDRQFLCHAVSAHFPDGTRALAVYTPKEPHPADPGTGAKSRTVRAHMGVSGYVVSPHAGEERRLLGPDRCQITMVLQMDPKGNVPPAVYNSVNSIMPLNLQRVRQAAARLKPEECKAMAERQMTYVTASKAEADRVARSGKAMI